MSGIFGIVQLDGQLVKKSDLERMRQSLSHRGPDGSDIWVSPAAGLGHLMLCSTPESLHEPLPWKHASSGLVITADARIDNRNELISAIGSGMNMATEAPDSQLILGAYLKWGETCVERLLGDFAFAVWNPRALELFCARDHLGVRPFYYYHAGQDFVFASAAQAVTAASGVPENLNEQRVADFLVPELEGVNDRCTFYQQVWRLPPAHILRFSARGLCLKRYWQPDAETELRLGSDDEYADAFQEVLGAAVQARLRSHKPPASMLSGGIDSSTVVGLAGQRLSSSPFRLRTYSGISDDMSACRESQNIMRVVALGGIQTCLLRPSQVDTFAAELKRVSSLIEDPFDSHCILLMLMYLSAAADGAVAVMDGLDGDGVASLPSIYPSYLLRDGAWLQANREIRGLWRNYYQSRFPLWRDYLDALKPVVLPGIVRRRRWLAGFRRMAGTARGAAFLSTELAGRIDLAGRFQEYYSHIGTSLYPSLRHAHATRITVPYQTAGVERYGRLAAYCGVEQRHPLLDKRVVEFCIGLPWNLKVRDGWSKYLLRQVAHRVAPAEVAWRQGWDLISWKFMEAWQALERPAMKSLAEHELAYHSDILDCNAVAAAMGNEYSGQAYGDDAQSVLYLLRWLAAKRDASVTEKCMVH